MTTSTTDRPQTSSGAAVAQRVLLGLAALAVLLQGVWAGMFLRDEQGRGPEKWIEVHALDGEVAIVLAALAAAVGFWKVRSRRDLAVGATVLAVLLVVESYLGGLIKDEGKNGLVPVHVPLAMALMGLAVWLVVRVRQRA